MRVLILIFCLINASTLFAQNKVEIIGKTQFSIGDTIEFHSEILNENRILNIYLPDSYEKSPKKSYPVIYLFDGSANEDFIHISGLVQFGSFSWINQIPESIVVGIANSDRKRDFTFPTNNIRDKKDFPSNGGSENFIRHIGIEIQPLINKHYRTRLSSTIIGQSLGGLLATEILFKSANLFDNYIIISPSLWWDDESLLSLTPSTNLTSKSIYIGVGKEGEVMERVSKVLFEKLNTKSISSSIHFKFFDQLSHGDTLHLAVYDAFDKIFRAEKTH